MLLGCALACTSSESRSQDREPAQAGGKADAKAAESPDTAPPEPDADPDADADEPAADVLNVGHMYWTASMSVLEIDPALIVAAEVRSLESHPSDDEARPGEIVEAVLDVHEVLHAPAEFAAPKTVAGDGFAGVAVGDKLVLFLTAYEGGFGLPNIGGANTDVGVKVESWDDPILAAAKRFGAGEFGAEDAEDIALWESVGVEHAGCFVDEPDEKSCPLLAE